MSAATRLLRNPARSGAGAPAQKAAALTQRQGQAGAHVQPLLARGEVHHQRLRPALHRFDYRVFSFCCPCARWHATRACCALHATALAA
jgi:hypothetical protein